MPTVKDSKAMHIPRTPFRFLLYSMRPHAWWAVFAILAVTSARLFGTGQPYIFKNIIDSATGADTGGFANIWMWTFIYIGAVILMFSSFRASGLLGSRLSTFTFATAYNSLFRYLSLHSHSYFSNRFAGALTNKVSHAADGTERLIENILWGYYATTIELVLTGVLIFYTNVWVGVIYVTLLAILIPLNIVLVKYRRPYVVVHAKESSALRGQAVDIASNIEAVRQFARRVSELFHLGEQVEKKRAADVKQWTLSEYGLMINNVLIVIAFGSIILTTLFFFQAGKLTLGDFIMVITLLASILGTLTFIGQAMNGFVRVYGDIEEGLNEVLLPHEIVDEKDAKELKVKEGEISFDDVSFTYSETGVFKNLSFTISSGEKVGIVGPSGAGKTTLVKLLLRQYDLNGGAIKIDGEDIKEVTQDSLRSAVAVVPQEPLLFHRSILENIQYGDDKASKGAVIEAAKMAQAHEFIEKTPEGYDTIVGERGVKLSGGQRQRVAIARAMLKNAPILVLDEATSSLDSESEVLIQKALHELMEGKTVLAIAHRLSTLREMDRILVFEDGEIVEDGTHNELVKKKGVYARLWEHQAGGFLKD